jgi:hypothetical protein
VVRVSALASCAFAVFATVASTTAPAAVTRDQFPPRSTRDLIALCGAGQDDPLMTAARNYCQGFAEGAVQVALSYKAVTRSDRQPFCLPDPRPSHDEALAQFVTWANADPKRLDEMAVVGLMRFLIHQYPCQRPSPRRTSAK